MDENTIEPTNTETSTTSDIASLLGTAAAVLMLREIAIRGYRRIGKRAVRKAEKAQRIEAKKSK